MENTSYAADALAARGSTGDCSRPFACVALPSRISARNCFDVHLFSSALANQISCSVGVIDATSW